MPDINVGEEVESELFKSISASFNIDKFLTDAMFPVDFHREEVNSNLNEPPLVILSDDDDGDNMNEVVDDLIEDNYDEAELEELFLLTDNNTMAVEELPLQCDMVDISNEHLLCHICNKLFYCAGNLASHVEKCKTVEKIHECLHCGKKFQRNSYRLFHENNCKKAPVSVKRKRYSAQTTLDHLIKRPHIETMQVGGSGFSEAHPETWKVPEMIESTLQHTAVTYRKEFDEKNTQELMNRLNTNLRAFTSIIRSEIVRKKGIKFYFSLRLNFCQSKDVSVVTDPPVTLRSEVYTALNDHELDIQFKMVYNQLVKLIDEFQRNGSGWIVDHFLTIDLGE